MKVDPSVAINHTLDYPRRIHFDKDFPVFHRFVTSLLQRLYLRTYPDSLMHPRLGNCTRRIERKLAIINTARLDLITFRLSSGPVLSELFNIEVSEHRLKIENYGK